MEKIEYKATASGNELEIYEDGKAACLIICRYEENVPSMADYLNKIFKKLNKKDKEKVPKKSK